MKKFAVLFVAVVMIVSMISFANAASFNNPEKFVVNVQTRLNVRSGPGMKYDVFAKLRNGTVIDVAGYENGWAIVLHDFGHGYAESIGYVDPDYLTKYKESSSSSSNSGSSNISTAGTTKYTVNSSGWLNVRKAKSISSARLGKLYKGDTVYVVSQSGNWSKIVYNGRYAYVMSKYISKNASESNLPEEGELFRVNVASGRLNVRTGMSTKKPIITRLSNGEYIKVIETYDEWSKIYYKSGKIGYVMNKFITPVK